jgi:hypothetical protein
VRLDDLVRPLLLPNNLKNVLIIALDGRRSDYEGRFQAFEFAGAASQFTIVRRTGKEVTLLKDLVAVIVSVSAKTVLFYSFG